MLAQCVWGIAALVTATKEKQSRKGQLWLQNHKKKMTGAFQIKCVIKREFETVCFIMGT